MRCICISFRIHSNSLDIECFGCAYHAAGNLASIGNQNFGKHGLTFFGVPELIKAANYRVYAADFEGPWTAASSRLLQSYAENYAA